MKQMLMHVSGEMLQTAVLNRGRLVEFFMERQKGRGLVGNVYKGRVVNVLPGMQAAFVDIGLDRNAFLYIDDLLHPHLEKQPEQKPKIEELVAPGQQLIVQVVKEPLGGKGARITTHFNLPGRWLVYMPVADYVGVSRKISSEAERERLRLIGENLRFGEEGIILRTAAAEENESTLRSDVAQLRELWQQIERIAVEIAAPAMIHSEAGLLQRIVRDTLPLDMDEIWIDHPERFVEVSTFVQLLTPTLHDKLRLFNSRNGAIFDEFHVAEQVEAAFGRRIPMDSGGYLIWDETEALTVIDVNTGKFTGTNDLEDTVFCTNMEAAELISRLLRIRDVGGIVIIDYIDMEQDQHRADVMARMIEETQDDGTKCSIVGWTKLGLLELTRKKLRENAVQQLMSTCASCGGTGRG